MSDYTPIVNYAAKDALLTGNPAKRILGTEITAELNAVQTMSQSKEDESNKGVNNGYAGLDSSGDVPRAQLPPTLAYEDETNVFTSVSIQAGPLAAVTVSSSVPIVAWNETDASANNRLWYLYPNNEQFLMAVNNDAINAETSFIVVNRTGSTIDSIALAATTVTVNGVNVRDGAILNAGSVPNAQISVGSVTQHQAALSIGNGNIADNTLNLAKLVNHAADSQVLGRAAGAGAGAVTTLSAAQLVTVITTADGAGSGLDADLLDAQSSAFYRDAGNLNAGSVPSAQISQGSVTQHQAALAITGPQLSTNVRSSAGATSISSTDREGIILITAAGDVTLPDGHGFSVGQSVAVMRDTSGAVNFVVSGAQTREAPGARFGIAEENGWGVATLIASNRWAISGT